MFRTDRMWFYPTRLGFIRDLPHELVAAFRATLRESVEADLILHVVDSSHPDRKQQMAAVETVLTEIGAHLRPRVTVYNKIDLAGYPPAVSLDEYGRIRAVWLSAANGSGCELIRKVLAEALPAGKRNCANDNEIVAVG